MYNGIPGFFGPVVLVSTRISSSAALQQNGERGFHDGNKIYK